MKISIDIPKFRINYLLWKPKQWFQLRPIKERSSVKRHKKYKLNIYIKKELMDDGDFQPDFSLKLDISEPQDSSKTFPYLRKYGVSSKLKDSLTKENVGKLYKLNGILLEISLNNNNIGIIIYNDEENSYNPTDLPILRELLIFHLSNISDIFSIFKEMISKNNRVFFRLSAKSDRSLSAAYHQDSVAFIIIQYFKHNGENDNTTISDNPVLGTNILITPFSEHTSGFNANMIHSDESVIADNPFGESYTKAYNLLKSSVTSDFSFKGKYKSLDTLFWPDLLLKHAIPSIDEEFVKAETTEKSITMAIIQSSYQKNVKICSKSIPVTNDNLQNNGKISFFCFTISNNDNRQFNLNSITKEKIIDKFKINISGESNSDEFRSPELFIKSTTSSPTFIPNDSVLRTRLFDSFPQNFLSKMFRTTMTPHMGVKLGQRATELPATLERLSEGRRSEGAEGSYTKWFETFPSENIPTSDDKTTPSFADEKPSYILPEKQPIPEAILDKKGLNEFLENLQKTSNPNNEDICVIQDTVIIPRGGKTRKKRRTKNKHNSKILSSTRKKIVKRRKRKSTF